MSNRLGGKQGTSYLGTNANQPPNLTFHTRDPDQNDNSNVAVGDLWLNTVAKTLWYLASLAGNPTSRGSLASWIQVNSGSSTVVDSLTGNSGGAVGPDVNGNINVLGDTTTINIVGNPGTNTLTASAGTTVATIFAGDTGTATPAANTINFHATAASGSSVLFSATGATVTLNVTSATSNTIIGNNAGNGTLSGSNNTTLGKSTGHALTTANANTIIGSLSGALLTTGSNNSIVGESAGALLITGATNILIGQGSGSAMTSSESNCTLAGHAGVTGKSNLFVMSYGSTPFISNYTATGATGNPNIFIGNNSGNFTMTSTADDNTAVGVQTLFSLTTGQSNSAFGRGCGEMITTGSRNIFIGIDAAWDSNLNTGMTTGNDNLIIGYTAANAYTGAESGNLIIYNNGVVGESNVMRIGNATIGTGPIQSKCFIAGIRGVTTDINDAVPVLIDSAGQLGTTSSSLRYKMNVEDMGSKSEAILQARPVTFNYKYQGLKSNYGLIAEELHEIMPELVVYDKEGNPDTIKYHEMPAILLNELQKLSKRVEELEKRVAL